MPIFPERVMLFLKKYNAEAIMTLTISPKGWVVIPAELRKKYHLHPGQVVQVVDYGGVLALVPAAADPICHAAGLLHTPEDSLTEALLAERAAEKAREDKLDLSDAR